MRFDRVSRLPTCGEADQRYHAHTQPSNITQSHCETETRRRSLLALSMRWSALSRSCARIRWNGRVPRRCSRPTLASRQREGRRQQLEVLDARDVTRFDSEASRAHWLGSQCIWLSRRCLGAHTNRTTARAIPFSLHYYGHYLMWPCIPCSSSMGVATRFDATWTRLVSTGGAFRLIRKRIEGGDDDAQSLCIQKQA